MKSLKSFFGRQSVRVLSMGALALLASTVSADAQISNGLTTAANELTTYLPLIQKIIYALAAIVFLVGGVSIFIKMSNGDQDVKGSIMMFVGGVLFLLIVGTIAPTLFQP